MISQLVPHRSWECLPTVVRQCLQPAYGVQHNDPLSFLYMTVADKEAIKKVRWRQSFARRMIRTRIVRTADEISGKRMLDHKIGLDESSLPGRIEDSQRITPVLSTARGVYRSLLTSTMELFPFRSPVLRNNTTQKNI